VGGFGVGPVESLVHTLHEIRHPVQMVVICVVTPAGGRLKNLPPLRHPMKIVGFTSEMDSWMLPQTFWWESRGLTSSEALARDSSWLL